MAYQGSQDDQYVDLLGGSGQVQRPDAATAPRGRVVTPEQLARDRAAKAQWLQNQGLDEQGRPLPAYGVGSPTATNYRVETGAPIGTGAMREVTATQLGPNGMPIVGSPVIDNRYQVSGAGTENGPILRSQNLGTAPPGFGGNSAALNAQTSQGTQLLQDDLARRQQAAQDQLTAAQANNRTPSAGTNQAATNAETALGPAPTVDMGVANRQQGAVDNSLDLSRRAVDAALTPVDNTQLERATQDARNVLDQMLNGPNTAARLGSQTLRSQLALAKSAAGGPGAVQEALRQAQFAAPELEAQAADMATRETLQRQTAAGQVAGQLQNTALGAQQNETQRIGTAAQAASGYAQGALGARGQDVQIAQANQQAASSLLQNVTQLTGVQLELDQRNQELIGQLARDAAALQFDWGQLSAQTQQAEWDRWVKTYGIDQAAAAQIAAAAQQNNKSPWDYIVSLAGAGASVLAAAV